MDCKPSRRMIPPVFARNGLRLGKTEKASLPRAENVAGDAVIERHHGIFADQTGAGREIEHLQPQGLGVGLVDHQADVIQPEGAAQRGGDRLEERLGIEAAHHRVIDFEQGAQPVALARQLLFVCLRRFIIQRIVHRHGHLPRHLLHELYILRGIGVRRTRAEIQPAQPSPRHNQWNRATGLDAVRAQHLTDHGETRFPAQVRYVIGLPGLERDSGGRVTGGDRCDGPSDYRPVTLQNVQPNQLVLGIKQREGDEIERYQPFEKPAKILEQSGKLMMDRYGLGDFEQGLISLASRIGSNRGRRRHGNALWASLQPYHSGIRRNSRPPIPESGV